MQKVFGVDADYAALTDAEKIRELCGLPADASDSAVVAKLETLVENRTYWQRVVLATTAQLREALAAYGFDELTNPQPS